MTEPLYTRELRSLITEDGVLELSIATALVPEPADDEVVVRIEAAPINPTDLAILFGPADLARLSAAGAVQAPKVTAPVPKKFMKIVRGRLGKALSAGVEGAGVVTGAGASEAAQALLGETVSVVGDGMFTQYRCVPVRNVLRMPADVTPRQAASSYVNPMTALAMVETLRAEGHRALVHTVAASNLGQMLARLCRKDGIGLVNIVRKPEQETLLRSMRCEHVVNSASDHFRAELIEAIAATGATLAFDAIGGGRMANTVLTCMEKGLASSGPFSRYGSSVFKQLYVYGRLDLSPQELTAAYGFAWSVGGWLLSNFLARQSAEKVEQMKSRVAKEIKTTFASHYAATASLNEALSPAAIAVYSQRLTNQKYLITPCVS